MCGSLPGGGMACAVFNTSYDPLPVRITAAKSPQKFLRLTEEGEWTEEKFRMNGDTVETEFSLEPGQFMVCKLI